MNYEFILHRYHLIIRLYTNDPVCITLESDRIKRGSLYFINLKISTYLIELTSLVYYQFIIGNKFLKESLGSGNYFLLKVQNNESPFRYTSVF